MGLKLRLYTLGINAGAAVGRPHSHGSEGRAGTQSYVQGWGQCPDYFLGPGLNWQVVVELHLYVSRAMLIKCELIVDHYEYLNKTA